MRNLKILMLLLAATAMVACGGKKSGSADKSSYEQLEAVEADLVTAMEKVTGPIDQLDSMIVRFTELPNKYSLKPDHFKEFISSVVAGQAMVPGNVDDKTKTALKGFAKDFGGFKTSLMNTPDNAKALVAEITAALAKVPVLAGKVSAEVAIIKANPFSSKADKAKAKAQEKNVKALQDRVLGKVKEIQNKAMGLPQRAIGAVAKFTAAMKKAGISSLAAAKATPKSIKDDAKKAASDAAENTVDSAKKSAEAATGK